jgi:hypothetical protein
MKPTIEVVKNSMPTDQVRDFLVQYKPRVVTEAEWESLRPFVLESLAQFDFGSRGVLQDEALLFTRFAAWAMKLGLPLEHEAILTPTLMEAYAADPSTPTLTPGNRWSIRRWGRKLTRNAPWEPARKARKGISPSLFSPYSDSEIDVAWRLAGTQTTELRRRTAIVLIGLCEGAGLSPDEAKWTTADDLEERDGVLWVHVGEPNRRSVPIRPRYADALTALAATTEPGDVLTGRDPRTNRASDLTAVILHHTDLHQAPRLSGRRLRHSWLRRHLEHDVPIRDLYHAAGSLDAKTLLDALRSLQPNTPDEYLRNLLSS